MSKFGILLTTARKIRRVEVPAGGATLHWMYDTLGCDQVETVNTGLPGPLVMLVDENARLKEDVPCNVLASWLHGAHRHGETILGDALILAVDGEELVGLPEPDADACSAQLEGALPQAIREIMEYTIRRGQA